MTKSPFELRADMIAIAKDYMDKQHELNMKFAADLAEKSADQYEQFVKSVEMYSIEEMMEKAKEMYSFVTEKK